MVRLLALIVLELAAALLLAWQLASPGLGTAPPARTQLPVPSALATTTAERIGAERPPATDPGTEPAPPAAQRDEVAAKWNPEDPVGVLLTGAVRWADGTRPTEASVGLRRDDIRLGGSAAADGSYAIVGLAPGTWTARVRARDSVERETTIELDDAAAQVHDFVLDRSFAVSVRIVTGDGRDGRRALWQAMPGFANDLHVAGRRERFPDRLAPTEHRLARVGDAKWAGDLNPKDGVAGVLHLASAPPAHAALLLRHIVLQQQVVQPGQAELTFVLDVDAVRQLTGSVAVRVLGADSGAPLTNAQVTLNTADQASTGVAVDADGRALVEFLAPGPLRCQLGAPGFETMCSIVRLEPGQRLDLGELRLGAAMALAGRVLDANGQPAATAEVTWTDLKWRSGPTPFFANRGTRVEADGSFQIWGAGRGRIAVTARSPDDAIAVGVFDNPPEAPVELHLVPAATCTVLRRDDVTKAFTLTVFDARRQPVAAQTLAPWQLRDTLSLPAGRYTYEVHDEAQRLVQNGDLLLGATPATLEIR